MRCFSAKMTRMTASIRSTMICNFSKRSSSPVILPKTECLFQIWLVSRIRRLRKMLCKSYRSYHPRSQWRNQINSIRLTICRIAIMSWQQMPIIRTVRKHFQIWFKIRASPSTSISWSKVHKRSPKWTIVASAIKFLPYLQLSKVQLIPDHCNHCWRRKHMVKIKSNKI